MRRGKAMTPPISPQPPADEPPNPLRPLGSRTAPASNNLPPASAPRAQPRSSQARSPHGTWELPVEEPPYAPPPAVTRPPDREVAVSTSRLWAGGGATALVAAGVGVVGVLFVRGVLNIPILSAKGGLVNQAMAVVPLSAGLAALAATALLHLLLVTTPRPVAFFGAICAIVIAIVVLQVFLAGGTTEDQVATAMLYVVIGIAVISLLSGMARTAVQPALMRPHPGPEY